MAGNADTSVTEASCRAMGRRIAGIANAIERRGVLSRDLADLRQQMPMAEAIDRDTDLAVSVALAHGIPWFEKHRGS
jgi:hypothetical protein